VFDHLPKRCGPEYHLRSTKRFKRRREDNLFTQLLRYFLGRNVTRFRGGLVFKAHRLLYHSTLGSRVIKKKKKKE